jgi:hypothetical protein
MSGTLPYKSLTVSDVEGSRPGAALRCINCTSYLVQYRLTLASSNPRIDL